MNYITAKFLKNDVPYGRSYTYCTEDNVKAEDMVTDSKGSKLVVVGEADMQWVETYGVEKVAIVKKYVEPVDVEESEE